jgi:uncharacterized protein Yka (UPF0111/DUF47 family)
MRLLPRQEEFFDLFVEVATRSHEAAGHLQQLFASLPGGIAYHVDAIKRLEHEADEITHEVVKRLDRTFITPIDREDIQSGTDLPLEPTAGWHRAAVRAGREYHPGDRRGG